MRAQSRSLAHHIVNIGHMLKKYPVFSLVVGFVTVLAYLWAHGFSFSMPEPQALENAGNLILSTAEGRDIASRPYTLLTNFFVHTTPDHLLQNMATLIVCGFFVEFLSRRFSANAVIFIASIPATATNLLVPGSYAGLSGYTMALTGAMFAYLVRLGGEHLLSVNDAEPASEHADHSEARPRWRFIHKKTVPVMQVAVLLLIFLAYSLPERNRAMTSVGNYAHIAGYLTGMVIGMNTTMRSWDEAPMKRWTASVLLFMALLGIFYLCFR